ncbi:MAG: metal-dependent transcriptional regulator [Armatimonadetes bacterium]|nr:metal-dependent transcriptional regulator [Armatimonadota bacterium]
MLTTSMNDGDLQERKTPTPPAIGTAVQDYLKIIYKLRDEDGLVSPSLVAERLGVSPAAVTKMTKRLAEMNLVRSGRNQRLGLTPSGEKIALEIVRHHRLLELYLKEALGYSWDQVDAEAERLEHAISEEFEERIDQMLGHPTRDPHGDPIPTKEGTILEETHERLTTLEPGQSGVVRRVRDTDPEMLRYMASLGLYPDASVEMLDKAPYGGPLRVRIGEMEHAIGRELADSVFVARATADHGKGP